MTPLDELRDRLLALAARALLDALAAAGIVLARKAQR